VGDGSLYIHASVISVTDISGKGLFARREDGRARRLVPAAEAILELLSIGDPSGWRAPARPSARPRARRFPTRGVISSLSVRERVLLPFVVGAVLVAVAGLQVGGQEPAPAPPPAAPAGPPPAAASRGGVQSFDDPLPDALSPRNASYDIAVRLDPVRKELKGRETIRWRNISAATTNELQFHLYWNAWRNADSSWLREDRLATPPARRLQDAERRPEEAASSDITRLRVTPAGGQALDLTGAIRYVAPDDGNAADRTVMAVMLPAAVDPGGSVEIEIEWTGRIPFAAARTGWIGDYFFFGQWFPKIGVLEDRGWNTHQFHRVTEFYADFGVYDVRMTVPAGYKVGASGREMRRMDNADGTTTHTYHADDVIDFDMCWAFDLVDPWGNVYELNCYDYDRIRRELIEPDGIEPVRYWPRTLYEARTTSR